jgi:hypothetical protein
MNRLPRLLPSWTALPVLRVQTSQRQPRPARPMALAQAGPAEPDGEARQALAARRPRRTGLGLAGLHAVFDAPTRDHWPAFSGAPPARTMHVRSVFHVAEATRLPAAAPTS